jgi:hypothetical protein
MMRRLLVGLVLGLLVGGLVAAGLVAGLHIVDFAFITGGAVLAYLTAAVTGVLTGLVAGKPIWASGAKIEAGLKAFFGALIGVGLMFALRQWAGGVRLDLSPIGAGGPASLGDLPAASLPLLAAVLGGFFELDNTAEKQQAAKEASGAKKRVEAAASGANGKSKARVPGADEAALGEEAEVASRGAKR